jgi:hypothetical protein
VSEAMRLIWALSGFALATPAYASDKLCHELEKFVTVQEEEKAIPMPRHWVEFHWGIDPDPNTFWSWGCRHAADSSSKQLCAYLLDNTSREFRNTLPLRIQQCMGYRLPKQAWSGWHVSDGVIKHQRKNGSWLVMEIVSQGLQQGESAVRISYDTVDRKLEPVELDPVMPLFAGEAQKLP